MIKVKRCYRYQLDRTKQLLLQIEQELRDPPPQDELTHKRIREFFSCIRSDFKSINTILFIEKAKQ